MLSRPRHWTGNTMGVFAEGPWNLWGSAAGKCSRLTRSEDITTHFPKRLLVNSTDGWVAAGWVHAGAPLWVCTSLKVARVPEGPWAVQAPGACDPRTPGTCALVPRLLAGLGLPSYKPGCLVTNKGEELPQIEVVARAQASLSPDGRVPPAPQCSSVPRRAAAAGAVARETCCRAPWVSWCTGRCTPDPRRQTGM